MENYESLACFTPSGKYMPTIFRVFLPFFVLNPSSYLQYFALFWKRNMNFQKSIKQKSIERLKIMLIQIVKQIKRNYHDFLASFKFDQPPQKLDHHFSSFSEFEIFLSLDDIEKCKKKFFDLNKEFCRQNKGMCHFVKLIKSLNRYKKLNENFHLCLLTKRVIVNENVEDRKEFEEKKRTQKPQTIFQGFSHLKF